MAAVAYTILVRALLKHHEPDSALARAIGSDAKGTISLFLYVLGILSSFVHTAVSLLFYVVVAVIWLVPDRRIERALKQGGRFRIQTGVKPVCQTLRAARDQRAAPYSRRIGSSAWPLSLSKTRR